MTGGRKPELTAEIDDYSIVGEIGIKKTSSIGNSDNHRLTLIRLFKINVLIMVVPREYGLREGCKPSTTPRLRTRVLAPGHGRQVARMDSRWMGDEGAALTGSA